MTCIAYRKGVMAADTQMTFGDGSKAKVSKVVRLPDGSLLGTAGSKRVVEKLKAWALADFDPAHKPKLNNKSEMEGLLVKKVDGSIWLYDWTLDPDKLEDEFFAIGSGGAYALGAMAKGATAVQAIRIAARYDSGTSEPIEALNL